MPNKVDSIKTWKQEPETNDFQFDRNNINFSDSQQNSRNDLENIIFFKDSQNDQISYSEQEDEIQQKCRGTRKKHIPINQNKKSISQDEKKIEFDRIIFYIQTEFCQQTLENYLQQRNAQLLKLRKSKDDDYQNIQQKYVTEAKMILDQIIKGLDYLHNECKLVHRDLKPGNIFMNNPDDVKIGDFGLVAKLKQFYDFEDQDDDDDICTRMYAAPEQINQKINKSFSDQKSDIYALGLIILLLFHPTSTSMEAIKVMNEAKKGILPQILKDKHSKISEIILECMKNDPKQRPNVNEIAVLDSINSLSSSKKSSNEFNSDSTDLYIKNIGNCLVKFEDEAIQEKYLQYNNRQIQIFKNQNCLKAQMIYNINECNISYNESEILVEHNQLENFSFKTTHNQLQDIYDQLCELTQAIY
ncbi:unnamed protein product (macronuclear) [Paramecium tetraurelia]|uniref:non-specific serine/threonine protein kinase n=1 Tax=Paramecium tetraurelia TaxID=5888 RepID=A0CU91_PARTE|nr:uncharacterized protein GSPATT00010557001 [Paramecium tetraurelia]CAK74358.1 unnamed protein product [Paramecium tetraurelia]|eukprot:XP_001441755.1 hypothetical protein (macronuclear) [Paramecium tetraurelia strain d4-2]